MFQAMKNKQSLFWFICSLFVMFIFICLDNQPISASELNFAVVPQQPQNQVNSKKSYFDLKVHPGQQQKLAVTLTNDTNQPVIVKATVGRAYTNMHGVVQYDSQRESDLKDKFDYSYQKQGDIKQDISIPKETTIPAKSSVDVPIALHVNEQNFENVKVAGINFKEIHLKDRSTQKTTNVINHYSYTVGVVLHNAESNSVISPHLALGTVIPKAIGTQRFVMANIHNQTPVFINRVSVKGSFRKEGLLHKTYKVNIDNKKLGSQIAPNSIYAIPFDIGTTKLSAGKYKLHLVMKSGHQTWRFDRTVTLTDHKTNKINGYHQTDWLMIGTTMGIIIVMILILSAIYIYFKKRSVK
ncbi:protein of unknown function [Weissella bombi]|uniref:Uncharacterized protein n=2 Tax=Weissella bombi TaxID=1505725 RepID=A0A1C4ACD4_9LACO|nr:protein of unknown function [Weissella bombi]